MNKPSPDNPDRRRHRREKATIDHLVDWPVPGSEDTELDVFMGPEVSDGEATVYAGVQA